MAGRLVILLMALFAASHGCGRPSAANIELRKQNQQLQARVGELETQVTAAQARIAGFELRTGTVRTLPNERLQTMFTVHGIRLGRLTGGADLGRDGGTDEGLKVYLTPVDEEGRALPATGRLDLAVYAVDGANLSPLGKWYFTPQQLKGAWTSFGPITAFVLELPWQKAPTGKDVQVQASFEDALTGRVFNVSAPAKVNPPPPTTRPATQP